MLISLVLHGFMLGLLFVTPYWSGLTPDADLNPIIDGFNVELVDVTMDDVKFNPKDFEKAKVVREKNVKPKKPLQKRTIYQQMYQIICQRNLLYYPPKLRPMWLAQTMKIEKVLEV